MFRSMTMGMAVAATLCCSIPLQAIAAHGANLAIAPQHSGESVAFDFSFNSNFGKNGPESFGDRVAFKLGNAHDVTVTATKSRPLTLLTARAEDGTLAPPSEPSPLGDLIYDYNAIVALIAQAPSSPAGSWKGQLPVRVSPDTWNDVTVDVHAVVRKDGGRQLSASGHRLSTLFFKGFTFPIDVTVRMTEDFGADGHLEAATFATDELTQGGAGPKISYDWSFRTLARG